MIKILIGEFEFLGYTCNDASEDADSLIINTAIRLAENNKTVVVVRPSCIIDQLNANNLEIYFLKVGFVKITDMLSHNSDN